jgi:PAS domain S-box-containing protein
VTGALDHIHLRALFDHLPTGVLIANDAARFVDANSAACALFGLERQQILSLVFWR